MKKIGILTFHRAYNFGAVLQTYALEESIRNISDELEVTIIDYRNNRIENWFHSKSFKSKMKEVYKFFFYHKYYQETRKKARLFDSFTKKYFSLSKECNSLNDVNKYYDAIVVGSDQVWNYDMTWNDANYFLPYQKGAKKLSYAASFGKSNFSEEQCIDMKKYLQSFRTVLVREGAGVKFANSLQITAQKVVDPTLLLNKKEWKKFCEPCTNIMKPYILVYLVAEETYSMVLAKKIAKLKKWDVVYLDPPRFHFEGITRMKEAGPGQFLWLIENAELVVTTSYHGLLFSINLNTPFLYELSHVKGNTNSRIEEIVHTYKLEKYSIESDNVELYNESTYNWELINQKINQKREESIRILKESITLEGM